MASFRRVTGPGVDLDDDAIYLVQADPVIEITDQILEHADPRFLSRGDGIVTFHSKNGDVSYGLRDYDDIREVWIGVRSDVSDEDLETD